MFKTYAGIKNGMYGINEYNEKLQKMVFKPLGKAVYIDSITKDIETGSVGYKLSWDYLGEPQYFDLSRKALSDSSLLQDLIDAGADITKKNFNIFVDTMRLQEVDIETSGKGYQRVYSHLGWKTVQVPSPNGGTAKRLCYRAATMVGPYQAKYIGPLKVTPMGTFEAWKAMVEDEILGHIPAEIVMLASLSALVNGLISADTTGENPIVHLDGLSSTGKSAIAMAGCSCYGEPFDGERRVYDANGIPSSQISCYGSWSATENATLGRCAGNRGCLIVLNELGKYKGSDMSSIGYNLSDGTDRLRLGKDLNIRLTEGYNTTILSVGEHSLLDRCQNKADGLRVRVLELDMPMTTSAENADRIKAASRKNNGHAAPMMAEFILRNGGLRMVLSIYDHWRKNLLDIWPDTPFKERFVSKFPALFLTTAELAKAALGITFSEQAIIDFFLEREATCGLDRNSAAKSYDFLISQCRIFKHRFYVRTNKNVEIAATFNQSTIPNNECWGRLSYMSKLWKDSKVIVAEFEIRKKIVEDMLRENGFSNVKSCIKAWRNAEVLDDQDATHPCRKRKIDPASPDGSTEPVYVLRVFCDPAEVDKHWAAEVDVLQTQQLQILPLKSKVTVAEEVNSDDA